MKLNITGVTRYDKDKEGNPLKTKDGRPYTRLVVRCKEYDKPISGFDSPQTKDLKEGDVVEAEVEQKGEYLNFRLPNKTESLENEIVKLKLRVSSLESKLSPQPPKYPEFEIEDNPPF